MEQGSSQQESTKLEELKKGVYDESTTRLDQQSRGGAAWVRHDAVEMVIQNTIDALRREGLLKDGNNQPDTN